MTTAATYFLLIDNQSHDFYIARRELDEMKTEFHDMRPGEIRPLSDDRRFEIQCCSETTRR